MELEVLSDLSEVLPYPIPDFPLYAGIGKLEAFNQYAVSCHWHPDFEFNLVLEGGMDYFVNGENIHLSAGDGIFVNSRRLHYNYSHEKLPCRYLVITVSPELFPRDLPALKQLLEDKTNKLCSDYLLLSKEKYEPILSYFPRILQEIQKNNPSPFHTLSYTMSLCGEIMPLLQYGVHANEHDEKWMSLYEMTGYIHTHYRENLTLTDIAAAGKVCRSKCCKLFTDYMGQSPIDYLIVYRLRKSQALLLATNCPVGEIAAKCGFSGQSYFTQMFKRTYGLTPREFRKG